MTRSLSLMAPGSPEAQHLIAHLINDHAHQDFLGSFDGDEWDLPSVKQMHEDDHDDHDDGLVPPGMKDHPRSNIGEPRISQQVLDLFKDRR